PASYRPSPHGGDALRTLALLPRHTSRDALFPRRPTHPASRHAGRTAVTTRPGHRPPVPGTRRGGRPRPGSWLPVPLPAPAPLPLPARLRASGPAPGPGRRRNRVKTAARAVGIPSARCGGVAAGVFPARGAEPVRRGRGGRGCTGGGEV